MIHYYRYLFVKMKVFNYSELHFSEGTSFKIHTLIRHLIQNHTLVFTSCYPLIIATVLFYMYILCRCNVYIGLQIVRESNVYLTKKGLLSLVLICKLKIGCFSLDIQNIKNDTSLFSLRNMKILPNIQIKNYSLACGSILDNLEINL